MMDVIKNMKNGKAAGVAGVSAELMKFITKNEDIRKYMLKCCNNVLKEKVQEDWLLSNTTMIPKVKKTKNSGSQTNSCYCKQQQTNMFYTKKEDRRALKRK